MRIARHTPKIGDLIYSLSLPDTVPQEYEAAMEGLDTLYKEALSEAAKRIGLAQDAMGTAPTAIHGFHMDYGGRIGESPRQ